MLKAIFNTAAILAMGLILIAPLSTFANNAKNDFSSINSREIADNRDNTVQPADPNNGYDQSTTNNSNNSSEEPAIPPDDGKKALKHTDDED